MRSASYLPGRWLWMLFLLALALRALTLGLVEADSAMSSPKADSLYFIEWAQSIHERSFLGERLFVQSPLYAYLLAAALGVTDQPLHAMRVAQVLLGSATVLCIALCAQRLTRDRRASLAAGLLAATYAPFLYYSCLILKETLGIFLLSLFFLLALEAVEREKPRWWGLSGLALGLFWLVRANAPILALPVLAGQAWKRRWAAAGAFLAGLALMVAPLTLRNVLVTGQFALTLASGGSNLYVGNNPQATGMYYTLPGVSADPRREAQDLVRVSGQMAGRPLSDAASSDFFVRRAVEFVASEPLAWLRLMLRKTLLYWNAFELPDNYDFGFFAQQLPYLRFLPQFWMVVTLGLAGLALPARNVSARLLRWEALLYMLSVLLFYVNARFRVVMVPLLLCGTALALSRLLEALEARRAGTVLGILALCGAAFALTQTSVCDPEKARVAAFALARQGETLLEEGRLAEAHAVLEKARALNPNDAYAHRGLGELALRRRDFRRAAFHLLESLRLGDEDPGLYRKVASTLIAADQRQQAVDFLIRATLLEPEKTEPHTLLRGLGYSEAQIRELQSLAPRP